MQIVHVHSVSGSVYSASQFRFKLRTNTSPLCALPILYLSTHPDLRPTRCSAHTVDLSKPSKHSLIRQELFSTQNSCSTKHHHQISISVAAFVVFRLSPANLQLHSLLLQTTKTSAITRRPVPEPRESQSSGLRHFMTTHFNTIVSIFRDWLR